jgi:hypothetical protein
MAMRRRVTIPDAGVVRAFVPWLASTKRVTAGTVPAS